MVRHLTSHRIANTCLLEFSGLTRKWRFFQQHNSSHPDRTMTREGKDLDIILKPPSSSHYIPRLSNSYIFFSFFFYPAVWLITVREVEGTVCKTVNKYLRCQHQVTYISGSNVRKLPKMEMLTPKILDFSLSLSWGESGQTMKYTLFWKSEDCFLIQAMSLRHMTWLTFSFLFYKMSLLDFIIYEVFFIC